MDKVTKKNIVEKVSTRTGLTQIDTKIVLASLLDAVSESLANGMGIELRGFGRFKVKEKKPRTAHNPRTRELVEVKGGFKPVFEASRTLRERVNKSLITR